MSNKFDEDGEIGITITDTIIAFSVMSPPKDGFLDELRQLTRECGVILIFDEVITGWKLHVEGAQEYFGVIPHIVYF